MKKLVIAIASLALLAASFNQIIMGEWYIQMDGTSLDIANFSSGERFSDAIPGHTILKVWNYDADTEGEIHSEGDIRSEYGTFQGRADWFSIQPTQITSDQNNYEPTGCQANVWFISSDAARSITGLKAFGDIGESNDCSNGPKVLINIGSFNITLEDAHVGSDAGQRFELDGDYVIEPGAAFSVFWDQASPLTNSVWRPAVPQPVTATDTLGPDGDTGDVVIGGSGTTTDIDELGVEAELESVMDLTDLQGNLAASRIDSGSFDDARVDGSLEADEVVGTETDEALCSWEATGSNVQCDLSVNAGTDLTADLEEDAHCSEHDSADVNCTGETIVFADNSVGVAELTPDPAGDDYVAVSDSSSAMTWRQLPDCDADNQVLHYDQATNAFSCGDDDTGGVGSSNSVEVSIALSGGSGFFSTTVTGQAWVASGSEIVCQPLGTTADGLTPEAIAIAGLHASVANRVAGDGFDLHVFSPHGLDGTVRFHCLGV